MKNTLNESSFLQPPMIQEMNKMGGLIFKKLQNLNKKIPLMKVAF